MGLLLGFLLGRGTAPDPPAATLRATPGSLSTALETDAQPLDSATASTTSTTSMTSMTSTTSTTSAAKAPGDDVACSLALTDPDFTIALDACTGEQYDRLRVTLAPNRVTLAQLCAIPADLAICNGPSVAGP